MDAAVMSVFIRTGIRIYTIKEERWNNNNMDIMFSLFILDWLRPMCKHPRSCLANVDFCSCRKPGASVTNLIGPVECDRQKKLSMSVFYLGFRNRFIRRAGLY